MIIFAPQEFIMWTNTLIQFPWPIQVDDFSPYAERLGWKPGPRPTRFSVHDDEHVTLGDDEAGSICELFLHMAINDADDVEGAAELNDHLVSCVAAGRKVWGESFLLEAGDDPTATWRFPGDMFAQVTGGFTAVLFQFFTPEGQWYFA